MNGFIRKVVVVAGGTAMLATGTGCKCYRDLVDPCWPQRYAYMARKEVTGASAPQIQNGHVLDQTIWNEHFEPGSDRLTGGGREHLAYLARRRPFPDPQVYLQTAQDVPYDPAAPEKFAENRFDLDNRRVQAVQKYLTAETAGRHTTFQVTVHDPSQVGMYSVPMARSILLNQANAQGVMSTTLGAGSTGGSSGSTGSSGGSSSSSSSSTGGR